MLVFTCTFHCKAFLWVHVHVNPLCDARFSLFCVSETPMLYNVLGEGLRSCQHTPLLSYFEIKLMTHSANPMVSLLTVYFLSPVESEASILSVLPSLPITWLFCLFIFICLLFLLVFLPRICTSLTNEQLIQISILFRIYGKCSFIWWLDNVSNTNKHMPLSIYLCMVYLSSRYVSIYLSICLSIHHLCIFLSRQLLKDSR